MATIRDYQAGEIVSVSLPFVHVLKKEFKGKNCDYCFVECKSNEFGKCGNCKKMYYCGKDCQKKDWNQHKLECKIYKENYDQLHTFRLTDDLFFRIMLRLNLYLKRNPKRWYEQHKFLYDNPSIYLADIKNLNLLSIYPDNLIHFRSFGYKYTWLNLEWDEKIMNLCYNIYWEYGLKIFDYKMQELGLGLYIAESQLTHSCFPCVTTMYNGIQLVMRATRSIRTFGKINVNYTRFSLDTRSLESRTELKIHYNYSCICEECDFVYGIDSMKKIPSFGLDLVSAFKSNDFEKLYEIYEKMISILNEIYVDYYLGSLLPKIIMLEIYANIHNDVKDLSVVELAKQLEIELPVGYNEIFENIYFNRDEKPHVSVMKALANVEFNVKN
ncbi:N-lysine methyltransferase SMYD2-like [Dermatophagoides pteronyssinus]|uniref:N-lysine methyltransferase SMYD2-like n=1 Tax=Dermatophagoides pteronyssinus TaxID=6956 RepID=UPI003F6807AF